MLTKAYSSINEHSSHTVDSDILNLGERAFYKREVYPILSKQSMM